ncbi:hypothetical protein M569_11310 [Genlisea aurea]|uniref:Uncharacterized protein n=1 Tax=Genlisea aurea TaxID=192259 RepID=S8CG14_9LAMI|nr:hypothetical protein M569_11310 [Genlisea aurea]
MATKTVRCNFCGAQTTIPSNLRPSSVRCPQCGSAAALAASKDPLAAAQNVVNCAANAINRAIGSYSSGGFGRASAAAAAGGWGRKKAVLCGVSYYGQSHRLQGTVNDVNCMKYFLVRMNGFPPDSIVLLTGK